MTGGKLVVTTALGRRASLARLVAEHIRERIMDGQHQPGQRLPSEAEFANALHVSRVTVRSGLRMLEAQGLIEVRQGSGSYVTDFGGGIRAGIQELRSISETIRDMGHEPGMQRRSSLIRPATDVEATRLRLDVGAPVIALERTVLADQAAVAFSYDIIPAHLLPGDAVARLGEGSIFATLDEAGWAPVRAMAEVHAVLDPAVGWGAQRPVPPLYVLLDQVHFSQRGVGVTYSRTFFIEGRFQFVVLRTR